MDHMAEAAGRKLEITDISAVETYRRMVGEMRSVLPQTLGIAREHDSARLKAEALVGPDKALQQPAAEKPGSTRNEDLAASKFIPQRGCERDNVI